MRKKKLRKKKDREYIFSKKQWNETSRLFILGQDYKISWNLRSQHISFGPGGAIIRVESIVRWEVQKMELVDVAIRPQGIWPVKLGGF